LKHLHQAGKQIEETAAGSRIAAYITANARAGGRRSMQVDISTDKNTDKTQPQLSAAPRHIARRSARRKRGSVSTLKQEATLDQASLGRHSSPQLPVLPISTTTSSPPLPPTRLAIPPPSPALLRPANCLVFAPRPNRLDSLTTPHPPPPTKTPPLWRVSMPPSLLPFRPCRYRSSSPSPIRLRLFVANFVLHHRGGRRPRH
jgi:hypothetical protein